MRTKMQELFAENMDNLGLICKNGDGGDCATNQFAALYCLPHSNGEVLRALNLLLTARGQLIRHPNSARWYSRPNTTSRDQFIPYLCFISTPHKALKTEIRTEFWRTLKLHARHLWLFTWNTRRNFVYPTLQEHIERSTPDVPWNYNWKLPDFCGPDIWATYLRGLMHYVPATRLLWPLLCILDLYLLLDSLWFYGQILARRPIGPTSASGGPANAIDHDKKNAMIITHYAATNFATPISTICWKLLKVWFNKAAHSFYLQPNEPRLDLALKELK